MLDKMVRISDVGLSLKKIVKELKNKNSNLECNLCLNFWINENSSQDKKKKMRKK